MNIFSNIRFRQCVAGCAAVSVLFAAAASFWNVAWGAAVALLCVLLNGVYFLFHKKLYQDIADLSLDIDRTLHGGEEIRFGNYREGDLEILQNELQKMVIRLREQAEQLKKEKVFLKDALADISHQLKTPLTSLNILISMLNRQDLGWEERQSLVRRLRSMAERIDWLTVNLLKISQLEADSVTFTPASVSLQKLIAQSAEPLLIPMELKEQAFSVEVEEGAMLWADLAWTSEALANVIKNCMEHTPRGGAIVARGLENPIYTQIVIEDNGEGIAAEDLPLLYERFYQGKNRNAHSTGLGLALAQQIVQRQGGIIKTENRREGGARFILRFYKRIV